MATTLLSDRSSEELLVKKIERDQQTYVEYIRQKIKCAGKRVPKDVKGMIDRLSPKAVLDQNVKLKTGLYKMLGKAGSNQPSQKKLILFQDSSVDDVAYERSKELNASE